MTVSRMVQSIRSCACPWVLVAAALSCAGSGAGAETIKVLVYGEASSVASQGAAITSASGGGVTFDVTTTSSVGSITAANLAGFDVFYAGSEFENELDPYASVLQNYLANEGGIMVGQANVSGPISWLPSSLSVNVASISYHSSGTHSLTAAGLTSPIFAGLSASDLGGGPADTVYASGLGSGWTVLANHTLGGDVNVAMAAGTYGAHRILLWPDRFDSNISPNPTSALIRQSFQWLAGPSTAVPEPSSMLSIAIGLAASAGYAGWKRGRKQQAPAR